MVKQKALRGAMQVTIKGLLIGLALILPAASMVHAQSTATILGTVKDATGAAVANVSITARSVETSQTRTTTTNEDGAYRFSALPVGPYEVRAERDGFNTEVRTGLTLDVSQEAVVNFTMQVGGVAQSISVTGEAPQINTTSGALGGLVGEQSVADLPLNGRNYVDLTLLQPGVMDLKTVARNRGATGNYFSSNGATPRSNNYTLDGASLVNMYGATNASMAGTTLGVDGIREYRVVTGGFGAEYGMVMGSQMVVVSKGGTNNFHGTAFEFLRNSVLDAKNFFDISSVIGRRLPEYQRNNFGGSFGGPIKKDKTFFFVTYEGLRENKGITTTGTTLLPACEGAPGATVTNVQCPQLGNTASVMVTTTSPVTNFYPIFPLPVPGANTLTPLYTFPFQQPTREDYGQIRVDHSLSASDSFFARYTVDDSTQLQPTAYPEFQQYGATRGQYITASENHIFSPTLLNTFRTSFDRTGFHLEAPASSVGDNSMVDLVPNLALGGLTITGVTPQAAGAGPIYRGQNIFQYSDDIFYTKGKHSLKFGTLINRYQQLISNEAGLKGSISFANVAQYLLGNASSFSAILPGSNLYRSMRYTTLGFYGQDDWQATSRLTLNLGLRYEFETIPYERYGQWSALVHPYTDGGATPMALTPGGKMFAMNPSLKNFGPRLGFAYDVFGDGKTAVRGSADMLYDIGNYASLILQTLVGQPPMSNRGLVSNPANFTVPLTFGSNNNALRPTDYYHKQPSMLLWNLTVDRQLPFSTSLTVAYVGSRAWHLDNDIEANPEIPSGVPGLVPAPGPNMTTVMVPGCVPRPAGTPVNFTSLADGSATACWGSNVTPAGSSVYTPGAKVIPDSRINTNLPSIADYYTASAMSWYNALQVGLNKRVTKGLQFQVSYTYSKVMDQDAGQINSDVSLGQSFQGEDPFHIKANQGLASFDVRHNFKFNTIYYLPNVSSSPFLEKVTNGWWLTAIISVTGGYPFTPALGANRSESGTSGGPAGLDHPDLAPGMSYAAIQNDGTSVGCNGLAKGTPLHTTAHWFDPCGFTLPNTGFLGTAGSNVLTGPPFRDVDFSIVKDTALKFLGEAGKIEFRSEIFNLFNHANWGLPNRTVLGGSPADTAENVAGTAGQIVAPTTNSSRQIQFALKLFF